MQYFDDEEIIDILSLLKIPNQKIENYLKNTKINITKDLNDTINPNTEIVKLANQIPENIKFDQLLYHLEIRIIQMIIQLISNEQFSNQDPIVVGQTINLVLDKLYLYLFKECQKVESISIANIFEL